MGRHNHTHTGMGRHNHPHSCMGRHNHTHTCMGRHNHTHTCMGRHNHTHRYGTPQSHTQLYGTPQSPPPSCMGRHNHPPTHTHTPVWDATITPNTCEERPGGPGRIPTGWINTRHVIGYHLLSGFSTALAAKHVLVGTTTAKLWTDSPVSIGCNRRRERECVCERKRERERDRETDRQTDRQTDPANHSKSV